MLTSDYDDMPPCLRPYEAPTTRQQLHAAALEALDRFRVEESDRVSAPIAIPYYSTNITTLMSARQESMAHLAVSISGFRAVQELVADTREKRDQIKNEKLRGLLNDIIRACNELSNEIEHGRDW